MPYAPQGGLLEQLLISSGVRKQTSKTSPPNMLRLEISTSRHLLRSSGAIYENSSHNPHKLLTSSFTRSSCGACCFLCLQSAHTRLAGARGHCCTYRTHVQDPSITGSRLGPAKIPIVLEAYGSLPSYTKLKMKALCAEIYFVTFEGWRTLKISAKDSKKDFSRNYV